MSALKIWADNGNRIGGGPCLHCDHEYGSHFESCKFHPNNVMRIRYKTAPKAFITFYNGVASDGTRVNLKYAIAYTGNLTDKKRLAMGRVMFVKYMTYLGVENAEKTWDEAPEVERLRWTKTRGGRYEDVSIVVDMTYNDVTFTHDRRSTGTVTGQAWFDNFQMEN